MSPLVHGPPIELVEGAPLPPQVPDAVVRLLGEEGLLERTQRGRVLRHVGFVQRADGPMIIAWPKLTRHRGDRAAARLLRILRRFDGRSRGVLADTGGRDVALGWYGVFLEVLDWTSGHGWVGELQEEVGPFADGRVCWRETLRHVPAAHVASGVAYLPPLRRRIRERPSDVAAVQAACLLDVWRRSAPLSTAVLARGAAVLDEARDLLDHAAHIRDARGRLAPERMRHLVEDRARHCTVDHEFELLHWLRRWLSGRPGPGRQAVFGLRSFAGVWEDACRVLLDAPPSFHGEVASQPAVRSLGGAWRALRGQRPDLMLREGEDIHILDAKYYAWPAATPGTADAIKQVAYALTLTPGRAARSNAWLVPTNDAEPAVVGAMGLIPPGAASVDPRFGQVQVIGVPWGAALDVYIGERPRAPLADAVRAAVAAAHAGA